MPTSTLATTGYQLSATGVTPPIALYLPLHGTILPGIYGIMSTGASMTFSLEVTGDDIIAPGYDPSVGNWIGLTNATGVTASTAATLVGLCKAIRAHVTAYTSGTLTFQVVQYRS